MSVHSIEYYPDYGIIAVLMGNDIFKDFNYSSMKLYDLNFWKICTINPNEYDLEYLSEKRRFKLMLQHKSKSSLKNRDYIKIKISFGYILGHDDYNYRCYETLKFQDNSEKEIINKILETKEDRSNTKITFNNKMIIRYDSNIIFIALVLKDILYCLPHELQTEIQYILYNLSLKQLLL